MDWESTRRRSRKRNNRNFYIITIGFICSLIFVIFAIENMMVNLENQRNKPLKKLHFQIENQCENSVPLKINLADVIVYSDTISHGKIEFEHNWYVDTTQNMVVRYGNHIDTIKNVSVTDSVSYMMMEFIPKNDDLILKANFFE